ncbi:MAG: hypothetical protein MUO62_20120, partial [Anaerolineales bacterium]|nr:hypothetical protein [Anaerolineales bacterium]
MPDKKELSYIPGLRPQENKPLDRYLPSIHQGVASTWLADRAQKSGWLLDPFGASPDLAIEAAQKGYRVLVTANNPVTRFVMEILANPPTTAEFQAALAMLASLQIGRERLEPHIKSLYETTCSECHQSIQADSFLWRRDEVVPYARIYDCPYCGDAGNRPANTADINKAGGFQKSGLHLARALERVAPLRDPDRRHVAEALEVYLPRAIYALLTIINKLSGIPRGDKNLRPLNALLLLAFDRANTLWLYPKERQRPRQLTVPSQFREHNIWSALESAIHLWQPPNNPVPVAFWPELPPDEGGICLFEGRVKELAAKLPKVDIHAVLTAFPRPNQAFWTLSALWSGWLWGHEAVEHFKSVLRRRRYDWIWLTSDIQAAISSLNEDILKVIPLLGLVPEVEPGFLSAVLLGCQHAKLDLDGIALRVDDSQA